MGSEEQQAEPDSEVKQWRISAAIWDKKYYIQVVKMRPRYILPKWLHKTKLLVDTCVTCSWKEQEQSYL